MGGHQDVLSDVDQQLCLHEDLYHVLGCHLPQTLLCKRCQRHLRAIASCQPEVEVSLPTNPACSPALLNAISTSCITIQMSTVCLMGWTGECAA